MKNITLLTLAFLMFFVTGCDSDFQEVNTNPNDPSKVPSGLLLGGIIRNAADQVQSPFLAGEAGSCWSQHLGKTIYNENELYIPRQAAINTLWNRFYAYVIKDADVMQKLALQEENSNMQGVALVMKAYGYSVLTDLFGDIPMKEALKAEEGLITPKYDSSKDEVYPEILKMLDEASALLNGQGTINAGQDLLYKGDWMSWKRFANSLKFRVLMRGSSNPALNASEQLKALVASGNLFTSNAQEAKLNYLEAAPNANPYYENLVNGGRVTEWSLGKELVDYMILTNDPRLPVYAQEVGGNGSGGGYVGKPAGIRDIGTSIYGDSKNISLIGEKYLQAEQPAVLMGYPQLLFLMAEAAEKSLIGSKSDAGKYYADAIKASFLENGLTTTGSFSLSYSGGEAGLEQIAKQQWVALYMQGFESWNEWRRTGIPNLPLAQDAQIPSIPVRLNYPNTQQSLNAENYNAAIAKQGADLLTTKLWWVK